MIVHLKDIPIDTIRNFRNHCGLTDLSISLRKFRKTRDIELKKYNATLSDDGASYTFDNESDYTFFLLRWS